VPDRFFVAIPWIAVGGTLIGIVLGAARSADGSNADKLEHAG
jgi:hypothetical protein